MYLFDGRITIEDKPLLDEYLQSYDHQTSGMSFSGMYMWRESNAFSWRMIGDYMCFAGISHLEMEDGIILPFMFMPLHRDGVYDPHTLRDTILEAREIFTSQGHPFSLRLVPRPMLDILDEALPGQLKYIADQIGRASCRERV